MVTETGEGGVRAVVKYSDLTPRQAQALTAMAAEADRFHFPDDVKQRMVVMGLIQKSSPFACEPTIQSLIRMGLAQRAGYNDRKYGITAEGLECVREGTRDRRSGTGGSEANAEEDRGNGGAL